jgi:hypothetical protein
MLKEGRPDRSEEQEVDMWRRWKAGYSIREICQALNSTASLSRDANVPREFLTMLA